MDSSGRSPWISGAMRLLLAVGHGSALDVAGKPFHDPRDGPEPQRRA
jgi:hypothetical protein